MNNLKTCYVCKESKVFDLFYKNKAKKNGIGTCCVFCLKIKRQNNREKSILSSKEYRKLNKEKCLLYSKNYRVEKKEWIKKRRKELSALDPLFKQKRNTYISSRLKTDINFKLACGLRNRIHKAIINECKIGSAVSDLGCSIEQFKLYIESKFEKGMTWDNWAKDGWHLDHIIPLSKFDLTDPKQFKIAAHYTNQQPLWSNDNYKKGSKIILKEQNEQS